MTSTPPDGFTARPATADDLEAAGAIVAAEEEALRGTSAWSLAELRDFWRRVHVGDGAGWLVERDGTPAAFGAGFEQGETSFWWITVHPDATGRGLATWLLTGAEDHAREHGSRRLHVGMFGENTAAPRLFERLGYREVRHYFQMRADLAGEPDAPDWPDRIRPDRFRPEDARAFHAAMNEAFANEWSFTPMPFEDWKRFRLDAPDTDVSLWFVARDGDEIAGFARCDARPDGGGWVGTIGVRPRWRRQGIGLALLREAMREFQRRGAPYVGLDVDAENPTGATRLYERAGMRVLKEDIVYEKELR